MAKEENKIQRKKSWVCKRTAILLILPIRARIKSNTFHFQRFNNLPSSDKKKKFEVPLFFLGRSFSLTL